MKNIIITKINMDLLEMVTGGTSGSCDPKIENTEPLNETGPLGKFQLVGIPRGGKTNVRV